MTCKSSCAFFRDRIALLLAVVSTLAGCTASGGNKHKQAQPIPPQPANVRPTTLALFMQGMVDTDGNGYADSIPVTVHLYSDEFPMASIHVPGSFVFKLAGKENKVISEWTFDPSRSQAALRRAGPGPIYVFRLSLLETCGDKIPPQTAELSSTFSADSGVSVSSPPTPVRVGRAAW